MARNTDFIGFTFNGCHSSEFNIYSVSDGSRYQDNLVPNPIDYTEQVPGGVGQYYFGSDMDIKEFPLSIAYDNLSELQVRELRNWLAPDTVGELIFDERPYKTYTAKISTSPSLSFICFDKYNSNTGKKERVYKGEGSINFVCYYPLGVASGEKKELKYYRDKIDDRQFIDIGGDNSLVQYQINKEVAVISKIYGKTTERGDGDKSPDNPYSLSGAEPTKVTVCGKNLANIPDKTVTNAHWVGYNNVYPDSGPGVMHMVDKSKIYTLSAYIDNTSGAADSGVKVWYTKNGTISVFNPVSSVSVPVGSKGAATYVIDLTALNWDGVTGLFPGLDLRGDGEGKTVSASQVQFEAGDAATPFEPYAGKDYPLTLTTPMYSLPGGADEIDLVSGAETRRCGVITLDGTETWMVRKANATSVSFVLTPGGAIPGAAIGAAYPAISTIGFRAGRYGVDGYEGATSDSGTSNRPQISVLYSRIGSSAEDTDADKISKFKVWLAAHPVTMVYQLANPVTAHHARADIAQPTPEANVSAAGTPVTVVYQLAEPVITTKGKMSQLGIEVISDLEESNLIVNLDSEKTNYFTNSNAGLSLRIYPQKYQNIDEWDLSSGLLETLDTKNPTAGYDHYITLPDNTKGIQLYNPGDKETDFILSFNKPTPMNDIFFTLSNGEQFILNLRSSDTDVEDYGAVSDAEKRVAAMTGGVITIDTKKNRIMYKYGTGENVTEESIYFALKKGQFFKIPKNKTSTGGYNLVIGTTSNIETDSIKISYDYLYY